MHVCCSGVCRATGLLLHVPPEAGMEVEGAYLRAVEASRVPQWDERESIRSRSRIAGEDCNCRVNLGQNPFSRIWPAADPSGDRIAVD
jgi:hypothetical protein